MKDEAKRDEEKIIEAVNTAEIERNARKAEREKKKLEAIQRSLARQENKNYFESKVILNEERIKNQNSSEEEPIAPIEEFTTEVETETELEFDPFRSYRPSQRPKVFIK